MNLRIYEDTLELCRYAAQVARQVEKRDRDLARQLRRCASSVALNTAEGSASQGNNRRSRYFSALGSAEETRACFHVAEAMGYVSDLDEDELIRVTKVIRTLASLTR